MGIFARKNSLERLSNIDSICSFPKLAIRVLFYIPNVAAICSDTLYSFRFLFAARKCRFSCLCICAFIRFGTLATNAWYIEGITIHIRTSHSSSQSIRQLSGRLKHEPKYQKHTATPNTSAYADELNINTFSLSNTFDSENKRKLSKQQQQQKQLEMTSVHST